MALAVCLLFDAPAERALRNLWSRLEEQGVPSLQSHTHGRHVPHVSYVVLRSWDLERVRAALVALPDRGPVELNFDAVGMFRRGRAWLLPAITSDLAARQERAVAATVATGAELHRHYRPGVWLPHCTIAPRVPLTALPVLASTVYDMLPLHARMGSCALINSATGETWPLPTLP